MAEMCNMTDGGPIFGPWQSRTPIQEFALKVQRQHLLFDYNQNIMRPTPLKSHMEPVHHLGFKFPDPFAPRELAGPSFVNALLATAAFRCWHILLFFGLWSAFVSTLNLHGHNLVVPTTLLTCVGTVLGFILSYRTTSSFERYNEGRRLWSQIIISSRTIARIIWFHVPDNNPHPNEPMDQAKGRTLIEKKTAINLLEAFAVATKHYLRGEDGIYYKDLYHLVKFLPAYGLPAEVHSAATSTTRPHFDRQLSLDIDTPSTPGFRFVQIQEPPSARSAEFPKFPTRCRPPFRTHSTSPSLSVSVRSYSIDTPSACSFQSSSTSTLRESDRVFLSEQEESLLLPAHLPPKYGIYDFFPFSLLKKYRMRRIEQEERDNRARLRAQMHKEAVSHNLPIELSLYLNSYVAALQHRKLLDVPTANILIISLGQLIESITGLERILTTPIPFSYSTHLSLVMYLFCFFLPFQIWPTFGVLTIPATVIITFVFFGFLVAGKEIENPFGYDKNDLNLDHFTDKIIRNELRAVTSTPPPNPAIWAFVPENDLLFNTDRATPTEWLAKGGVGILRNL